MSVIAEFRVAGPGIPTVGALAASPEMRLHVEQVVAEDPEEPLIFAWARGGDFEAFERALSESDVIKRFGVLESLDDERLYRIRISADAEVGFYAVDVELGTSRLETVASHEGLDLRMRFPDQDALQQYFDRCRDMGVTVSLRRLYHDDEGDPDGDGFGLSPKQREALEDAYQRGFFDVPRESSLSEVAGDFGVSEQALSERLRRATSTLIEETLDPDRPETADHEITEE